MNVAVWACAAAILLMLAAGLGIIAPIWSLAGVACAAVSAVAFTIEVCKERN